MNPSSPSQATARLMKGFSSLGPSFGPSLALKDIMMKMTTNSDTNPSDTAMKPGVVAVGAVRRSGSPDGRSERSGENKI